MLKTKSQERSCEGPGLESAHPSGKQSDKALSLSFHDERCHQELPSKCSHLGEGQPPNGGLAAVERGGGSGEATWDRITVSLGCWTSDSQLPCKAGGGKGHRTDLSIDKAAPGTLDSNRNGARLYSWDYFYNDCLPLL